MSFGNVLLLDSSMAPIRTISWRRALTLWIQQKARMLEEQSAEIVGDGWTFPVPSVLQLKNYIARQWDRHVNFSRQNIFFRDNFTCQYCHERFSPHKLTLEHVLPRSRGGKTNWQNIVASCFPCNQRKRGRTPEEANMKLKKKPEKPSEACWFWLPKDVPDDWEPYISWQKKR